MKGIDALTLGAAKKYIEESLLGAGALKGDEGKSAYEIAVEEGFSGTKAEWLDSLKGGNDPTDIDFLHEEAEEDDPLTDINFRD